MQLARVETVVERHLRWLAYRNLAASTIYQRRRHLDRLAKFVGKPLLEATDDDMIRWQDERLMRLSPAARANHIAHARAFYKWAQAERLISGRSPIESLVKPKVPKCLPRPIPEDDLLLALDTAPKRIRPWIALAGWAGLRACEIATLHRDDVLDAADPPVLRIRGKGSKMRIVPIGPALLAELRAAGLPKSGYVFTRRDGQPGPNQAWLVSHMVNDHLHSLGIPYTLHKMRHRFGTQTYRQSKDILVVQNLMGHESPVTTAGYAAFFQPAAVDAVVLLDKTLKPRRLRSIRGGVS